MKIISSLCAVFSFVAATAAFGQDTVKQREAARSLPNIPAQNKPASIQYLPFPDQEINGATNYQLYVPYGPNGIVTVPAQGSAIVHPDIRVDLNLSRTPLREALKRLFALVKRDFTVEKAFVAEPRITLRVKNVTFLTALNAITEEANIGWSAETSSTLIGHAGKYHIGMNQSNTNLPLLQWHETPYFQENTSWNLQQGDVYDNRYNMHYDIAPDMFLPGSSAPRVNNLQPDSTALDRSIKLTWNYTANLKTDFSFDNTPTIRLPLNYSLGNGINLNSTRSPILTAPSANAAPQPDKEKPAQDGLPVLKDIPMIGRLFTVHGKEERALFTCPHCHHEITIVRKTAGEGAPEWKFCPVCGKQITAISKPRKR